MMQVTIDTNCLIDLEEGRSSAQAVRALHQMHKQGEIRLRVVAVSASERKPGGSYAKNFQEFQAKLAGLGLGDVEILSPPLRWGISSWGHWQWADDSMVEFEKKIHEVLFPEIEFEFAEYCARREIVQGIESTACAKWRNAKCDVQIMWAHIHFKGDIFVSSDSNFFKESKKEALKALGAKSILKPNSAVEELQG